MIQIPQAFSGVLHRYDMMDVSFVFTVAVLLQEVTCDVMWSCQGSASIKKLWGGAAGVAHPRHVT